MSVTPNPGPCDIRALLDAAEATAREVGYPDDPALWPAYQRQLLLLLAQGYTELFSTSVAHPDWVPHTGSLYPWGAPNHDTLYAFAPIEASGIYRVAGALGTESIAQLMFRRDGANTGKVHGATLGEIDLCELPLDGERRFSLLLAAERPAGYQGLCFPIPAGSTGLIARHVTETAEQLDGVWTLERLDAPRTAPPDPMQDMAARTATMMQFVAAMNTMLLRLVRKMRDGGHINRVIGDRFQGNGGIAEQMYYQGLFEFDADEVLVVECEVPRRVHYWSVQLLDPFYSAIDYIQHSAAYNRRQARLDADGRARFVISVDDPGVHNWLDPAGWRRGGFFWRWHRASEYPQPVFHRVKRSALHDVLPRDTARCGAAERAALRTARITQYQSRRRW